MASVKENISIIKKETLEKTHLWRLEKFKNPELRTLFLELTRKCNEHCLHCGSSCGDGISPELDVDTLKDFLLHVKDNFDISNLTLAITGGEPLLYKDFFELMEYASSLGYHWGMTSNGTLITKDIAQELARVGMKTISISIDGLQKDHDSFRRKQDAYNLAMNGVQNLIDTNKINNVQITTVVTHNTVNSLPAMFEEFSKIDIDSWRISNVEPIGRALLHSDLMLNADEYRYMFDFIRDKRRAGFPLLYGCQHFLGLDYEAEVRDWFWFCSAGVYTASITCEGNITACLDIGKRPEVLQGNILSDSFADVWKNKFKIYRQDLSNLCSKCSDCKDRKYCMGGPFHSWDYDNNEPLICMKNILF